MSTTSDRTDTTLPKEEEGTSDAALRARALHGSGKWLVLIGCRCVA
jgi:hypothetical protein